MSEEDGIAKIPYISSPRFRPFWDQPKSWAPVLREKKLQLLGFALSGLSAWFAWQNNLAQKAAGIPKIAVQTITLSPSRPNSFDDATLEIDYRNIGGSARGGTKVAVRVVLVGTPAPIIVEGDDADPLLSGDIRAFRFPNKAIPGPQAVLVACFTINDSRAEPEMFGFTFSKEQRMFHLDSRTWSLVQQLAPCK